MLNLAVCALIEILGSHTHTHIHIHTHTQACTHTGTYAPVHSHATGARDIVQCRDDPEADGAFHQSAILESQVTERIEAPQSSFCVCVDQERHHTQKADDANLFCEKRSGMRKQATLFRQQYKRASCPAPPPSSLLTPNFPLK